MPRIKGKGLKIAYSILGVPPQFAQKPNKVQQKINRKLLAEETQRVR